MATYGSYKKIGPDAVIDGTVSNADFANGAIQSSDISNNTITDNELASSIDLSGKTVIYRQLNDGDFDNSAAISTSKFTGFVNSATIDTTDASNITSGTLSSSLISSLSASKLTGTLPNLDANSVTGLGKKVEVFRASYNAPGAVSDGGRLPLFTFTTTFRGVIVFGWEWNFRTTGNGGFNYVYPELTNSGGSNLTVMQTYGVGYNIGAVGWNIAGGGQNYGGPRNAGTYGVRLRLQTNNSTSANDDSGRELHYTVWNVEE